MAHECLKSIEIKPGVIVYCHLESEHKGKCYPLAIPENLTIEMIDDLVDWLLQGKRRILGRLKDEY